MIKFTQVGDGKPRDVEVLTDDHNAELALMTDVFERAEDEGAEFVAARRLADASMEDGELTFVIPGEEVAEIADWFEDSEEPRALPLQEFLDQWNAASIRQGERELKGQGE